MFLTLVTLLAVRPAAAQKKKPVAPSPPMVSTEDEAERKRFLDGLRSAKPMPIPMRAGALKTESTPPGQLVERELATGTMHFRNSHFDLESGVKNMAPEVAGPRMGDAPRGAGDGILGSNEKPAEGTGDSAIKTASATPPSPFALPYSHPFNTVYKLLVRFGNDFFVCSAASASSFHLISAGHCIYNQDEGGWASEVWAWGAQTDVVLPRFDADFPYGVAKVTWNTTYNAWINSRDFNWDFSFLTLDRRMGDHTGWMGRETSCGSSLWFDGYPIESPFISFADSFFQFPGFNVNNVNSCGDHRIGLDAFIYGGHSGGPEFRHDTTGYWIEGVNSTSNRAGLAEGTRYTSTIHNDLSNQIANDRVVRPPVDRPDLIEYVFNVTSKGMTNTDLTIGSSYDVQYNEFNGGFVDSGAIAADFYLSRSSLLGSLDYYLGTQSDPNLGAFFFRVGTRNLTVPPNVPPGNYFLGYVMRGDVPEATTDNNKVVVSPVHVFCPADAFETDDTAANASTLVPGIAQTHALCPAINEDWAKFTLTQTSGVTLSTDGPSGDTVMTLLNSSLGEIAVDDDGGNDLFSMINRACGTNPLSAGTYYVKVTAFSGLNSIPSYRLNLATTGCPAPGLSSMNVTSTITGGLTGTGRVVLASAAGAGGVTVSLSDNSGVTSLPSTVNVPAGATMADFAVRTSVVTAPTTVTVRATLNGIVRTDTMVVNPASVTSISISPVAVNGGTAATGTVTLSGPAANGGTVIALAKSDASVTIPATVTVAAGHTSMTFPVTTTPVTADKTVTFTATLNGVNKTDTLVVRTPVLSTLTVTPGSVTGGTPATGTVTITSPAPTGGIAVTLLSSDTVAATVPSRAVIPAGATAVDFFVTSRPVLAVINVTITGTRGTVSKADVLKVNAPTIASMALAPPSVKGGVSSIATVTLTGPAPSGFVLTLSSSNTAAATVPATATVSAGASTKAFTVTTKAVTADTSSSIKAAFGASSKAATLTVTK